MTAASKASKYRFFEPFLELLRQGMSPEKIALTIALGIILGVTPVLGSTTLLCTLAAIVLRLNLPAIQLVNAAVYPLQLILLIPFFKLGAWLFRAKDAIVSLKGVASLIHMGLWYAVQSLWVITVHALVAWLALGLAATAILYAALVVLVRQFWRKYVARASSMPAME